MGRSTIGGGGTMTTGLPKAANPSSMTADVTPALAGTASRFEGISRTWALLILTVTTALMIISALFPMAPPVLPVVEMVVRVAPSKPGAVATTKTVIDDNADLTLYRTIIERVAAGEGYYPAIAELHRTNSYPLRPFIVFRLPTLAYVSATLGMPVVKSLLWALLLAVAVAWWVRLDGAFASPPRRIIALVLVVFGLIFNAHPEVAVVHEVWASLLLALSWAIHRTEGDMLRWLPSVMLGLMAVLVRETALPFVLLMGAFALWQRRWLEMMSWGGVVAVFALAMAVHADHVAAVTTLNDLVSEGWNSFGGWPFFVFAMWRMTQLMLLPAWLGASMVPLMILGWASWRSQAGLFGLLLFGGYGLMFMILGRPENFYWALMIAPLFMLGLAFLPEALSALLTAARQPALLDAVPTAGSVVPQPERSSGRRPKLVGALTN
jgi:hypothetical protein